MTELGDLFEDLSIGPGGGPTAHAVVRALIGVVGTTLAIAGGFHILSYAAGIPFRLAAIALFVFLGCFCLFNIALHREWRWPSRLFVASFALLFLVRILFSA